MRKVFQTHRCSVVELNLTHQKGFVDLHSNPHVMNPIPAEIMTKEQALKSLEEQMMNYQNPSPKIHVWAIEGSSKADFMGTCALIYKSEDEVEIGYRIAEEYWQQRYATEICKELIRFAFASTKAKRVVAEVNSTNFKSIKILERYLDYTGKKANRELDTMDLHYAVMRQQWILKN